MTWPSGLAMSGIVSLVVEGRIFTGMESASGRSRSYKVRFPGVNWIWCKCHRALALVDLVAIFLPAQWCCQGSWTQALRFLAGDAATGRNSRCWAALRWGFAGSSDANFRTTNGPRRGRSPSSDAPGYCSRTTGGGSHEPSRIDGLVVLGQ
jgi:hypothetical protein